MKLKHVYAQPKEGESLHEYLVREERAYQLRRDELRLAMEEGAPCDVDIEARLREKGLADGDPSEDATTSKTLTWDDMRALHGDEFMRDFERQFTEHLKRERDS